MTLIFVHTLTPSWACVCKACVCNACVCKACVCNACMPLLSEQPTRIAVTLKVFSAGIFDKHTCFQTEFLLANRDVLGIPFK